MAVTHHGSKIITTPRMTLRPFRVSDAVAMFKNWASDPLVTRFLTWPTHKDADVSKRVCAMWEETAGQLDNYQWCIDIGGEAFGSIGVVRLNERAESCELGWCISRALWNRGYMTEAAEAMVDYLFNECGFYRISALHAAGNPGSGRVMQKLGMRLEGVMRSATRLTDGSRDDLLIYAVLKDEWRRKYDE